MTGYFEPLAGCAVVAFDDAEISILRNCAIQLLELIGPGEEPVDDVDDLLSSVFNHGPSEPPTDPVLARLFPDAYGDFETGADHESRAASAEFRRYTETDLRARKRRDARTMLRSLDTLEENTDHPGAMHLGPDECRQWLGGLNDLRLAIGTRLEIVTEADPDELLRLPDDDPRKATAMVFLWLGALQESLVDSLTGITQPKP